METLDSSPHSGEMGERNKRRRIRTNRFEFESLEKEEQRLLQQAIKNSQREKKRMEFDISYAPTFYPTVEEFKDPLGYIKKISPDVVNYGICKIVPPSGWDPPCQLDMNDPTLFRTRLQAIHTLQESQGYGDGKQYNLKDYKEMADTFAKEWMERYYCDHPTPPLTPASSENPPPPVISLDELAKDYWSIVETRHREAFVEYGNDLEIADYRSGFIVDDDSMSSTDKSGVEASDCEDMFSRDYYARTGWNLVNIATCKGSLLKYLNTPINGVNVPWVYIGMLFATFCWHMEDNYLYSINYNHFGAIKQWYGVPGAHSKTFEKVAKDFLLELFEESPDLLQHMTTQISPSLLYGNGVPLYQARQDPKTFIVTFPKAFHAGFSYGFNCGEAVNFALDDWLVPAGVEAEEKYRLIARPSVFSHQRLLFTLLQHKQDLQPRVLRALATEIIKIVDEELATRPYIYSLGVRDLTGIIDLPPNNFSSIDKEVLDFDDLRSCHICTHICVFSAIACECDNSKVACIRHASFLCKCPKTKQTKYMLAWASDDHLRALKREAESLRTATTA